MADLVERAGARAWTEAEADRHIQRAQECLAALTAPAAVTEALHATALFVTRRDR
jgi:geranylgeranyl diphosphate synthase type I